MTYIFSHIQKTGGSTFCRSYVPGAFKSDEYFIAKGEVDQNTEDLEYLSNLSPIDRNKLSIIGGHRTDFLRAAYPESKYLSLVRDPVERILSLYLFILRSKDHPAASYIRQNNLSFDDVIEQEIFDQFYALRHTGCSNAFPFPCSRMTRNYQSEHLVGLPVREIDINDVEGLLKRVQSRFHLVWLTEDFERFLFILHLREGFPLILFNNRKVRTETFELTAAQVKRVCELNELDVRIYELIKRQCEESLSTWTAHENSRFEEYCAALKLFQLETSGSTKRTAVFSGA